MKGHKRAAIQATCIVATEVIIASLNFQLWRRGIQLPNRQGKQARFPLGRFNQRRSKAPSPHTLCLQGAEQFHFKCHTVMTPTIYISQRPPSSIYMGKSNFMLLSSVGGASIPISPPNMTLCADLSRLTNCTRTIVTMDGLQIWVLQADLRCLSNCLFRERHPPGKELRPHTDTIISAKIGSRMSLETFAHAATISGLWLRRTNGL